jgi:hypothetical protein
MKKRIQNWLINNEVFSVSPRDEDFEFSDHGCDCCNNDLGANVMVVDLIPCDRADPSVEPDTAELCHECICAIVNGD